MSLKKMLAILAACAVAVAALAIYVLVIEPKAPTTDEALQERGLVFSYKDARKRTIRDVATKIEIHRGKETVLLEKAGAKDWRLVEPVKARADPSAVLTILDHMKDLRIESIAATTQDPEELAKFGLKDPRLSASVWLDGQRLDFAAGNKTKGERAYANKTFLRVGNDPRVLVVDEALAERLDKPANDFRDKKVFDHDPEKAVALAITTPQRSLELAKAGKDWELTAPVADAADAAKVRSLLSKARDLQVEKFISEDDSKLADYGLDKPQVTCATKGEDGVSMTLLIGAKPKDDDKALYAKRGEAPSIFTIKADFLKDLEVKPEDLRQRQVAAFERDDATRLEITRAKATWAVARKNKDESWQMAKPKEGKCDVASVDDFVRNLERLQATRWVDDPKDKAFDLFKQPDTAITLLREPEAKTAKKQPPILLAFSAPVKTDKEEGLYVRRGDQKFLLFVSSKKPADSASNEEKDSAKAVEDLSRNLALGPLAFYDRTVFSFKDDEVTKLAVERDSLKFTCERVGENWKLTSPVLLDADKISVNRIANALASLKAEEYVAEAPKDPKDLKRYGLDAPASRFTATIEEKKADEAKDEKKKADEKAAKKDEKKEEKKIETKTLLVSRKMDGKVYGMAQGGTLVFTLRDWDIAALRTEPLPATIAEFTEDTAASLSVAHLGKPEIVIAKEKDVWAITKPKKAEADQEAVKKAMDALGNLRAVRYLDYEGKAPKTQGLDPAEVVVTVKFKEKDKKDFVLEIGKPVPGETEEPGSYAQKADAKQVFLMAKATVGEVALALEGFEKKPEPKKEEPKKEEPKKGPEPPKPPEPKAPEPKAPEPKKTEAKAPEPKAPEPKAPVPKKPETKAPEPKAAEPKAPQPQPPPPKAPEPKAPEPKAPEPKK